VVPEWNAQANQHISKKKKRNMLQNFFELELQTAVTKQLYTNRIANIHSTISYQPTKPTTRTTIDTTNDTTNKNSPHANGTATHPTTQDPTPHTKTQ